MIDGNTTTRGVEDSQSMTKQESQEERETMRLVRTKVDQTADGKMIRLIVGKHGDDICGAIFIKQGAPLPKSILMSIPEIRGSEASQNKPNA